MITVEHVTKTYGTVHRGRRRHLHRPARSRHRVPRDPTAPASPPPCASSSASPHPTTARAHVLGRRFPTCPTRALEVGVLLDASAQHAGRTGREVLTLAQKRWGYPAAGSSEVLDLVGLSRRRGRPPGRRLLARHAAAARPRPRAPRRPGGPHPRRARQRPRPGRHPLDARTCCAATPTAAPPSCSPRTCCTRSRSSPTTWSSSGNGHVVAAGTKADLLAGAGTQVATRHPDRLAEALTGAGLVTYADDSSQVPDQRLRARRGRPRGRRARSRSTAGVALPSCGPPTAPAWRRCSSTLTADTQRESHPTVDHARSSRMTTHRSTPCTPATSTTRRSRHTASP